LGNFDFIKHIFWVALDLFLATGSSGFECLSFYSYGIFDIFCAGNGLVAMGTTAPTIWDQDWSLDCGIAA
jgi:hypothetical protein